MSLKPQKLDSIDAKATRVLVAHGRAPNFLRSFDASERAALAKLVDSAGNLAEGAAAGFREVLVAYNDRLKATDDSLEGEIVTVQETRVEAKPTEPVEPAPETAMKDDAEFKEKADG